MLIVLAGGPRLGVHDRDDEQPGTGSRHPADHAFVVAVEANRGADFPVRGLDRQRGGAGDAVAVSELIWVYQLTPTAPQTQPAVAIPLGLG